MMSFSNLLASVESGQAGSSVPTWGAGAVLVVSIGSCRSSASANSKGVHGTEPFFWRGVVNDSGSTRVVCL